MLASIYDIFGPIVRGMGWLLAGFYSVIPNLGVGIILLTFTIMLVLYPLTVKQTKSMIAMQRVQPEIKKLQAKYKNDRQKLNEEIMKFYQENKINPLAGCLPLLVQLPVFISLMGVLRESSEHLDEKTTLYKDLCQGFGNNCGDKVTKALNGEFPGFEVGSTLIRHLKFLGMDLQRTATEVNGLDTVLPYLMIVVVMLTGYLQSRQAQKRAPAANKQMATVMKVLPVFFGLMSLSFASGVVLYFMMSNIWRLGQQEVIFRRHVSDTLPNGGKRAAIDVPSKERPPKRSGPRESAPPELEDAEAVETTTAERTVRSSEPARVAAPAGRRGGLRGLFQLPPPEGNGGASPRPVAAGAQARSSGPSSSSSKPPPQQRRRNNKKKKKRKR